MSASITNQCPSCEAKLDVSDHPPYARIVCPACGQTIRVRRRFDHFEIRKELGSGGMSRVFLAKDLKLDREVALKILNLECSRDERRLKQFEREAEITAQFSNPNVVKVYKVGRDQGLFYIAMEVVDGGSLEETMRAERRVAEERVLEIGVQAVQGLKAAQAAGLIHRDIKPGNILFTSGGVPKLVDFGLAMFSRENEKDKEIWATPFYVPPETLFAEDEDFRSDMYALGASLYHAAVGKPPYEKDTGSLEELRQMKSRRVDVNRHAQHLHAETRAILVRCLERKPADRYASYDEFLDHLKFAQRRLKRGGNKAWPGRRSRLSPLHLGAAAAAGVAIIGGMVYYVSRPPAEDQSRSGDSSLLVNNTSPVAGDNQLAQQFLVARADMLQGKFSEAREGFERVAASPAAIQPTLNWARFDSVLCSLFLADLPAAQRICSVVRNAGVYSTDPAEADLAQFFVLSATWLENGDAVPVEVMESCPGSTVRAIGLLAGGLKNWNLGQIELAGRWLRAFEQSDPPQGSAWIDDIKRTVQPWLEDSKILASLPEVPKAATTLEAAEASLARARSLEQQLTVPGPSRTQAAARVQQIAAAVNLMTTARNMADGERETVETTRELALISAAVAAGAAPARAFDFPAVIAQLKQVKPSTPAAIARLADEIALVEQAASFLPMLVADLTARPLASAVLENAEGKLFRGEVSAAPDHSLRVKPAAGAPVAVPAARVPPGALVELARRKCDETADSDESFRRWEIMVAFAIKTGCISQGTELGTQLAAQLPSYRSRWDRIRHALSGTQVSIQ